MQMKTLCLLYFTSININLSEGRKTSTIDRRTLPQILRQIMRLSCTHVCVFISYIPGMLAESDTDCIYTTLTIDVTDIHNDVHNH